MSMSSEVYFARKYCGKAESAKDKGIAFELTFAEFKEIYLESFCAYTGKKLKKESIYTPKDHPESFSFERINPNLGYTVDNTLAVTSAANSHKSSLDAFVKGRVIPLEMKIKLMRKALYQLEKELKKREKEKENEEM